MKATIFRVAAAVSALTALAMSVGAGKKWL
jgi:hypothetical protein